VYVASNEIVDYESEETWKDAVTYCFKIHSYYSDGNHET
jgi:hypothetical protein